MSNTTPENKNTCPMCGGSGKEPINLHDWRERPCTICNGTGLSPERAEAEPKKLIARRGDLRREVNRMVKKWFGEPVQIVEDELVDFITAEINREKHQWKNR